MSKFSRLIVGASAVLMLVAYVTPIWTITLDAPQYPEGLGMYIRIDNITGIQPNDLQNINGLNHYIGMKRIEPDSIRELTWMPWIVAALIVLGLAVAASGKRSLLYLWVSLFLLVAIVGMADFYLWEYDYGHNLDLEHASIQVPGMSYQPPLIGSKKLLNFTANSWPSTGGIAIITALFTGLAVTVVEFRARRTRVAKA